MASPDRNMILSVTVADPMRTWNVRGIASVRLLVSLGAEHGLSAGDCLRGSAITVEGLANLSGEVETNQELAVVRNLSRRLADVPGRGREAGKR